MRNVKWLTCLLALAAYSFAGAVSAQEQLINGSTPVNQSQLPAQDTQQPGEFSELPPHQLNHPSVEQSPDRSLLRGDTAQAAPAADASQNTNMRENPRGELGIWLAALQGPGLEIRRITTGSAAEQAGLRAGDVLMQINDRWASSPRAAAELIRAIPIGETVKLQIWRDGQPQELSAKIAAVPRPPIATNSMSPDQQYQVGFRGDASAAGGELSKRVMQLEQRLGMVSQELQRLREQLTQMRTSGIAPTGNETNIAPPPQAIQPVETTAAQPGIAEPQDSPPAQPAIEQPTDEPKQPEADKAPATETQSDDDSLFK